MNPKAKSEISDKEERILTNRGFYHIIIIQEVGAYDILAILKESTLVLGVPLPRTLKCGTI